MAESANELSLYLQQRGFPNQEDLKEVDQQCVPVLRVNYYTNYAILRFLSILLSRVFYKLRINSYYKRPQLLSGSEEFDASLQTAISEVLNSPDIVQEISNNRFRASSSPSFRTALTPASIFSTNNAVGSPKPQKAIAYTGSGVPSSPYAVPVYQRFSINPQPTRFLRHGNQGSQIYTRFYIK